MFWSSGNYWWITMEGSSETGWQRSDSSRGVNTSAVWDRNLRELRANRNSLSGDASHGSEFRKDRDRIVLSHIDQLKNQVGSSGVCEDDVVALSAFVHGVEWGDVSLRQWLDKPDRSVDAVECLHIFRQIVEIVNVAHSQGVNVHNVRPSCFVMSSFNHVSFIESASCSDSGSDSFEDGQKGQSFEIKDSVATSPHNLHQLGIRLGGEGFTTEITPTNASQIVSETSCMQSSSVYAARVQAEGNKNNNSRNVEQDEEKKQPFPMKQILLMETSWYASPEEIGGASSSCASDIYRLGILLFELFCPSSSRDEKSRTMSSLRHRVLPPQLLLKWPKEASFCLWLLHPEPSSRPPMGELLESEFLNEARVNSEEREAAIELRESIEEEDLLLEFLLLIQQRNQESAQKLQETVSLLSFDIEEVSKLQTSLKQKGGPYPELSKDDPSDLPSMQIIENEGSASLGSRKRFRPEDQIHYAAEYDDTLDEGRKSYTHTENEDNILSKSSRLMKNFKKLEAAYFLTRRRQVKHSSGRPLARHSTISSDGRGSIVVNERSSVNNLVSKERFSESRQSGWINPFLEGLCKYLSYSKLKVKADLKQGDLLNSSNLVCSLTFDRDGEYFATAGVNKKIKVFECNSILNEDRDIHYPVIEMATKSKISSICWNTYIKSQIASSNFDGVVQLWDVTRNQVLMEMREHERRVWSIDFSSADPTMLASGSDDFSVKLWSINQGASIGTIKTKANVCCVQFPLDSARYLAFGSADHKIYYYDLRNSKLPLCTLVGHNKTVSYVKFVDSTNLVSASTDNTIKLWDLSMCTSRVLDSPLQSFTGHMNVKNFVGLSVSDGYIATGSETNEVFIYHKAFPMPALSYKFNTKDPLSGHEMDDAAQFISSVCWRGQSSTLVAANSTGNIKILEMV